MGCYRLCTIAENSCITSSFNPPGLAAGAYLFYTGSHCSRAGDPKHYLVVMSMYPRVTVINLQGQSQWEGRVQSVLKPDAEELAAWLGAY